MIFVSSGTNAQFSPSSINELFSAFKEIESSTLVLWSLAESLHQFLPKAPPSNLIIQKFFPQRAILQHPKTELFLSHCGANSMYESIAAEVPILAIPMMGDQTNNANKLARAGATVILNKDTMTKSEILENIKLIMNNPSFKLGIVKQHQLMDYAGGAAKACDVILMAEKYGIDHLIPDSIYHYWFFQAGLDVYLTLFGVFFVIVYLFYKVCKCCFCRKSKPHMANQSRVKQE